MGIIIAIGIIYAICEMISSASAKAKERAKQAQAAERERVRRMAALEKEQERQRKEQERLAKEQERQAAQLAKHEEQIAKLEQKMSLLEDEMRFNEHQRGSVSKLLNIAEEERDCLIKGSKEWQRAHKKVIALENQYHTYDKRLKKAMSDYKLCKMQKSA